MTIAKSSHYISGILNIHDRFEKIASRQTELLNTQIKGDFEELDRLEEEKLEKMADLSTTSWGNRIWTPISNAVQYVMNASSVHYAMNASSVFFGSSSLLQQGYHLAHVVLVATGVAGLANRILQDTGLLKTIIAQFSTSQQIQEAMTAHVAMGNLCLSIGLGLIGAICASHTGLISLGHSFKWQTISSTAMLGLQLGQSAIQMKIKLIEKQTSNVSAIVQRIQTSISHVFQQMRQHCKTAEHILQGAGEVNETTQQCVASTHLRN